jgi:hypothetical protein
MRLMATDWAVRYSHPRVGRDFPHPSRPALAPTQPPDNGYWVSFAGTKRSGCGVDHPLQSRAELKVRVTLYLYSPSGPSWHVLAWTSLHCTSFRNMPVMTYWRTEVQLQASLMLLRAIDWMHVLAVTYMAWETLVRKNSAPTRNQKLILWYSILYHSHFPTMCRL